MKRLVTLAACLAMLTFTGCANGILGGGLCGGSGSGCNSSPSLLSGSGGFLSDGPIRQFFRGDACDTCNSAAGQISSGFSSGFGSAPTCDACGSAVPSDPFANTFNAPVAAPNFQPTTSFYPSDSGVSLGQPLIQDGGVVPLDPGAIIGNQGAIGGFDSGLAEPPNGIN